MTVSAPAERPRILARLAEKPGQTAYEVAAALGYGKPDSRRVAEIVKQMYQQGILIAGSELRPTMGRPAHVYYLAPPGTPPPPRRGLPATEQQARRRRNRIAQQRRRARLAGKAIAPEPLDRPGVRLPPPPPVWHIPGDPACEGASPNPFFGPDYESPRARARREAQAKAYCIACPVRGQCLAAARERGERYGIWGAVNFETERKARSTQATRPDVAAPGRA